MNQTAEKTRYVVMTGATRGIGRAMAEAVLQADPDVRVINLGRGTHDDVVRSLDTAQGFGQIRAGERISYMSGVDLSDTSAVERAVKIVIAEIKSGVGGEVVGVINCAGQAALDGSEETSQMQVVNTEAPIQIAEALKASGLNAADFRYLYVSSLAAHPKGSEIPRLHGYGESKKAAVDRLKSLLGEQLAVVYPGVYETDMVDAFFSDLDTAMEFYAAPPAEATPSNRLSVESAAMVLGKGKVGEIIQPALSREYVRMAGPRLQKLLLPLLVSLFAKYNLRASGQNISDHHTRVERHRSEENYGKNPLVYGIMKHMLMPAKIGELLKKLFMRMGLL